MNGKIALTIAGCSVWIAGMMLLPACVPLHPVKDPSTAPVGPQTTVSITDPTIPTMTPNGDLNVVTVYSVDGNASNHFIDKDIDFFTDPLTGCKYMNVHYGSAYHTGSLQTIKRDLPCFPPN